MRVEVDFFADSSSNALLSAWRRDFREAVCPLSVLALSVETEGGGLRAEALSDLEVISLHLLLGKIGRNLGECMHRQDSAKAY